MNEQILTGYHGTSFECIEPIIREGFKESISDTKKHWLGRGTYFFEDLYYAIEWTILGIKDNNIYNYNDLCNNGAVFKVEIDIVNYEIVDFSLPLGYSVYEELIEILKKNYNKVVYEHMIKNGDANIIRALEKLEKKQNIKYISLFDVICAMYPKKIDNKDKRKRKSDFIKGVQRQICVKNSEAIKSIDNMNLKDKHIEILYELIIKNRRNKNDK